MALKKCAFEGCDETFEPGYHQGRRRFCDIHFVGNTAAKAKKKKRREPATPAATAPADESNLVVPIDLSTSQLDRIWVTFTIVQRGKGPERPGDLFMIGQYLGLDKVMIRIVLTPTQWSLLARSAGDWEKE